MSSRAAGLHHAGSTGLFFFGLNLRKCGAEPLRVAVLRYSGVGEMRLIRGAAFREPHRGVLTGSRCDSLRKIFRFMPKVGGGLRNHDEHELPAQ